MEKAKRGAGPGVAGGSGVTKAGLTPTGGNPDTSKNSGHSQKASTDCGDKRKKKNVLEKYFWAV